MRARVSYLTLTRTLSGSAVPIERLQPRCRAHSASSQGECSRYGDVVIIRVSAVVLRDAQGRVLMVRKRGTSMWMNPGGKPEPGESAAECAVREVAEELGLSLDVEGLVRLGEFSAPAANEKGFTVVADVFDWPAAIPADVQPTAEIEETRWVTPGDLGDDTLAPLFVDHIAPALAGRGYLGLE